MAERFDKAISLRSTPLFQLSISDICSPILVQNWYIAAQPLATYYPVAKTVKMTRWHAKDCQDPDVYLDAKTPTCRRCSASARKVLDSNDWAVSNSTPAIPPDELPGNLNLRWPQTVPYIQGLGAGQEDSLHAGAGNDTQQPQVASTEDINESEAKASDTIHGEAETHSKDMKPVSPADDQDEYPYDTPLQASEFRLMSMNPTPTMNYLDPIHLDLELYPYDNCPEYEAISYTWGGEEDDSSL